MPGEIALAMSDEGREAMDELWRQLPTPIRKGWEWLAITYFGVGTAVLAGAVSPFLAAHPGLTFGLVTEIMRAIADGKDPKEAAKKAGVGAATGLAVDELIKKIQAGKI